MEATLLERIKEQLVRHEGLQLVVMIIELCYALCVKRYELWVMGYG